MTDVIDVLERLGVDPSWNSSSPSSEALSAGGADALDASIREAMFSADADGLKRALSVEKLAIVLMPAEEEDGDDEGGDEEVTEPATPASE